MPSQINKLLVVSGSMLWIVCIVENATICTKSEFGDPSGDVVIDAEGHRSVCYCLVPKKGLNNLADHSNVVHAYT